MSKLEPSAAAKERTVLIVDDEEPNRQLLSALLSAQGYSILTARDGATALEQVAKGGIDLMLLDVMMPGMDGLEVCQRTRKELNARDLTIVFVTALSDRESRMRAKIAGADDFLVKPIDSFELTFRVANWMKLRTLRDLEQRVGALSRSLVEVSEVARVVSSQVADAANVCRSLTHGASADGLNLLEVHQQLERSAGQLVRLSEEAKLAALTRNGGGGPPHPLSTKVPAEPRNHRP